MGYRINIGRLTRELEEFSIGSIRYPYLPVVGDRDLIIEAVRLLIPLVPSEAEVLLAPEFGGAVVAHQLSVDTGLPYIVARKRMAPVFGTGITIPVRSAAADQDGRLHLAERDARALRGRSALLVDEVVCGGGTMKALEMLIEIVGARLAGKMAIATQGDRRQEFIALLHLPQLT